MSNSFYNVTENIDLAFIAKINEKIKVNALKFLNKEHNNKNNNSDINLQFSKHSNHFNLILRDTHTIDRKLEKIMSAFTLNFPFTHTEKSFDYKHSQPNSTKVKHIKKRETILNLGLISPYLGIASTDSLNDIYTALNTLDKKISNSKFNTEENLAHIHESLLIISKAHDLDSSNIHKTTHFIFFYLKMQHITNSIILQLNDISTSVGLWRAGIPSNIIFDFKKLDTLFHIDNSNDIPLFNSTNFTAIPKSLLSIKLFNNTVSHTVSVPIISPDHICECEINKTFSCGTFNTNFNIKNCLHIMNNSFFCNTRPCLYMKNQNSSCFSLTVDSFILESGKAVPCTVTKNLTDYKHIIIEENTKQVLLLSLGRSLHCNNFKINALKNYVDNSKAELLYDIDNYRQLLIDENSHYTPILLNKIDNIIKQSNNSSSLTLQNSIVYPSFSTHHEKILLSNVSLTLIFGIALSILFIKIWRKKKGGGAVDSNNSKNQESLRF